jgi:SAM-dependent methyltransferase
VTRDRIGLARTFDRSAGLYDEARPGYPPQLFDDLARVAGLEAGARVLELGCGTGKASVPLAERGYRLICLEPGPNLASVARRNLAGFSGTEVLTTSLEDWPLQAEAFDLVAAATSWEWMDPDVKYQKVYDALRSGGCIAIFSNGQVEDPDPKGFWAVCQDVYRRHAPHMVGGWRTMEDLPKTIDSEFLELGFEDAGVFVYPWVEAYDTDRYIKVLQTFSNHIALPDGVRAALLEDMAGLIDERFGGVVEKHWFTTLEVARKA